MATETLTPDVVTRHDFHEQRHRVEERLDELINEGVASGRIPPVHAAFMGEAIGLLVEATVDGRLQKRTGLSPTEAFSELNSLVLHVLRRPSPAHR